MSARGISKKMRLELVRLLTGQQASDMPIPIDKNFSLILAEDGGIAAIHITNKCLDEIPDDRAICGLTNFIDQQLIDYVNALALKLGNWGDRALQNID